MKTQIASEQKLIARWISVKGKLICKWDLVDVQKDTEKKDLGIVLNFPAIDRAA